MDLLIQPLNKKQVYDIAHKKEYCDQDLVGDTRLLARNRSLRKNALTVEHLAKTAVAYEELDELYYEKAIIICCDEKGFGFGDSSD